MRQEQDYPLAVVPSLRSEAQRFLDMHRIDSYFRKPWCGVWHKKTCVPGFVYVARGAGDAVKIGMCFNRDGAVKRLGHIRGQYKMGFTLLFVLQTHCGQRS